MCHFEKKNAFYSPCNFLYTYINRKYNKKKVYICIQRSHIVAVGSPTSPTIAHGKLRRRRMSLRCSKARIENTHASAFVPPCIFIMILIKCVYTHIYGPAVRDEHVYMYISIHTCLCVQLNRRSFDRSPLPGRARKTSFTLRRTFILKSPSLLLSAFS